MKIKNLLLFAAASMSVSAFAQATGETADYANGKPTTDHFFVRGNYDDNGGAMDYDNTVSFKAGTPQLVWIHLDDDAVYLNEEVQSLTPEAYNAAGDLYNEITYNGFQFDVYMPKTVRIVTVDSATGLEYNEDEAEGDQVFVTFGDRMPTTSTVDWAKKENTKTIDGMEYDVYTFTCYNSKPYGTHFSGKNAATYKKGALKKDAQLLGIYLQNDGNAGNRIEGDMILANMMLVLRETPDMYFYGTGGNQIENRYMMYNRVAMYGSDAVVENLAQKTVKDVKFYNVAGMESNVPFEGVNIMVTTYNDGTTSTCKVIK